MRTKSLREGLEDLFHTFGNWKKVGENLGIERSQLSIIRKDPKGRLLKTIRNLGFSSGLIPYIIIDEKGDIEYICAQSVEGEKYDEPLWDYLRSKREKLNIARTDAHMRIGKHPFTDSILNYEKCAAEPNVGLFNKILALYHFQASYLEDYGALVGRVHNLMKSLKRKPKDISDSLIEVMGSSEKELMGCYQRMSYLVNQFSLEGLNSKKY